MKNERKQGGIKKVIGVVTTLALSVALFSGTALAAEVDTADSTAMVTFESGDLTLGTVPSFDFGTQTIPSTTTNYSAEGTGELIVSDLRGTGAGWNVTASLSAFQNSGENTLAGASILLTGATVDPESGTVANPPTVSSTVTLTSDGILSNVESAATGAGQGLWSTNWSDARLRVYPGTVKTGQSISQIDWYLNDTP